MALDSVLLLNMAIAILVAGALFFGLASASRAAADEFSWELSALVDESKVDVGSESQRTSLAGTYYFDPVDEANGPYALASFFDPATRVSLVVNEGEQTAQPVPGTGLALPGLDSETSEYSIGGRYVLPQSKWYFGGRYGTGEVDDPPALTTFSTDVERYGVLAGKYFGAATTLELAVEQTELDGQREFTACTPFLGCFNAGELSLESTTDTTRLDAMHVRRFGSLTYALFGGIAETSVDLVLRTPAFTLPLPPPFPPIGGVPIPARTIDTELESFRTYSVGGELFPTAKLGVRLGYTRFDGDALRDDAYELSTTWFFRRNAGLQFTFSRQQGDPTPFGDNDADGSVFRVIGRLWECILPCHQRGRNRACSSVLGVDRSSSQRLHPCLR